MFDIEATVTETGPTVLKLTADWPVDWLRETGIRTIEIQSELFHGEVLDILLVCFSDTIKGPLRTIVLCRSAAGRDGCRAERGEKPLIVVADADGEHIPVEREVPSPFNGGCKTLAVS